MALFARGRRWLSIASLATLGTALLHTLGQFGTVPEGSELARIEETMRTVRIDMGAGMVPSIWDIFRDLAFTMSITVLAIGVFGLLVAADREAPARLVRRVSVILAITCAALAALCGFYRVFPPLLSFAILMVLYGIAATTARRANLRG